MAHIFWFARCCVAVSSELGRSCPKEVLAGHISMYRYEFYLQVVYSLLV